ncbi:hypothetical protein OSTOST_18571 [Ostertagia ostertagi]
MAENDSPKLNITSIPNIETHQCNTGEGPLQSYRTSVRLKASNSPLNFKNASDCVDPSQEVNTFVDNLLNAPRSPIREEMPFNFDCNTDNDGFDPTAALNISAHSNGAGGDFAFDFGSTPNGGEEGDDGGFQFNFGGSPDNNDSNGKAGGSFNLFGF